MSRDHRAAEEVLRGCEDFDLPASIQNQQFQRFTYRDIVVDDEHGGLSPGARDVLEFIPLVVVIVFMVVFVASWALSNERALLLVLLDDRRRSEVRRIGILSKLAERPPLAQQIPAPIELDLDRREPLAVIAVQVGSPIQPVFLVYEPLNALQHLTIRLAVRHLTSSGATQYIAVAAVMGAIVHAISSQRITGMDVS